MRCLVFIVLVALSLFVTLVTAGPCKDKSNHCAYWKRMGNCNSNPDYMHKDCKKSCGLCPVARRKATSSSMPCKDKSTYCSGWTKRGECSNNPVYMKENCCDSCRKINWCVDKNRHCRTWTLQGQCTKTADYMKNNCALSCNKCPWESWGSWSGCNCGTGLRTRSRKCPVGKCIGSSRKQIKCSSQQCVSTWSKWGKWSGCTKRCGGGIRKMSRKCSGAKCPGVSTKVEVCNLKPCPYSCGQQYKGDFSFPPVMRVVGGKAATAGKWPWQVALVKSDSGQIPPSKQLPFCGGTLISADVVLTAAHCFIKLRDPQYLFVRVGDLYVNVKEKKEKTMPVKEIIVHKQFNLKTYANDIAIVILINKTLKKELGAWKNEINIACLPESNEVISPCYVTGWGRLVEGGSQANVLQEAKLPIVKKSVCNTAYQIHFDRKKIITDEMICAGYKQGGVDACQGDSGGPLVCSMGGRFILKGIVSWGIGCANPESYGVYTNVHKYMKWIKSNGKLG